MDDAEEARPETPAPASRSRRGRPDRGDEEDRPRRRRDDEDARPRRKRRQEVEEEGEGPWLAALAAAGACFLLVFAGAFLVKGTAGLGPGQDGPGAKLAG